MDKSPHYKIKVNADLNSDEGIDFVSLVDFPAIESNWVAFSKQASKKYYFDQDKQMLYGAILIPDKPIERFSEELGKYYITFPESEVIALVRKFQSQKKTLNLNYQHQKDSQLNNAVIQEIWLTGKVDKSQTFGFDFPVNTAMVGVHIGDSKFWELEVKTGNVKGFSIEGWLDMELKSIKKMNKEKFVTATTKDGVVINTDAEKMEVGAEVYTIDVADATKKTPVADGKYTLENGTEIEVAGGKITSLVEDVTAAELDPASVEVIQKAIAPLITELRNQIAALKVELANLPAGKKVEKEKEATVQMSAIEKVKLLINTKTK